MTHDDSPTRRGVLKTSAGLLAGGIGLSAAGAAGAAGKPFGRVYANGVLWRTNVVNVLDDEPDPADLIYFLHDGEQPIVARSDVTDDQLSPFVSESAPGDRDWNGGQWVHVSAEVTDVAAFDDDAPFTSASDVLGADYVETSVGRPGFGPPNYFVCPLNGRA